MEKTININIKKILTYIIGFITTIVLSLMSYGIALPIILLILTHRYAYKKGKEKRYKKKEKKKGKRDKLPIRYEKEEMKERDNIARF